LHHPLYKTISDKKALYNFSNLMTFPHKHLISGRDLAADDIVMIFDRSREYLDFLRLSDRSTDRKRNDLQGVSVVLAFFENSTRTRVSFELAAKRLGAEVTAFQAAASSVAKGETLLDTILNIETMKVDILVMRHHHSGAHEFLALQKKRVQSSIVNAGDGQHEHPTQGLLDAFTLHEKFGSLRGMRYCLVGDILHSRVARSNIPIFQALGAEVAVCGPGTLMPNLDAFGVKIFSHIDEAVAWADALNVLRIQHERMQQGLIPTLREFIRHFGVKRHHIEQKPSLAILHPGPINRGIELEAEVADAAQSLILSQVERGVVVRMAVLSLLAEHRRKGNM
jgi:aspartate carbamoyltransferase catalytic subunit